jgi:hypothetical protein
MVTTLVGERKKKDVIMYLTIDDVVLLSSDALVKSALKLKKYRGVKYHTVAQNIPGLIPPGSTGVNHGKCNELSFNPARHFLFIGPCDRYSD